MVAGKICMQRVTQFSPKHTSTLIDCQGWSPQIFDPRLSREWEISVITPPWLYKILVWSLGKYTRGNPILTKTHKHTHLPSMMFLPNFHPLYRCRSRAAWYSLSIFDFFKVQISILALKFGLYGSRHSPNLTCTMGSSRHNSPQVINPCTLAVPAPFIINYVFFSPNQHSSVKNWTKWIPIFTKLGVHHGLLPPKLTARFQLLLPLRSRSAFISFLFISFKKLQKTKKNRCQFFGPLFCLWL